MSENIGRVVLAGNPISSSPQPVDGLCPIAWRVVSKTAMWFDRDFHQVSGDKSSAERQSFISVLATTELMARRHPKWFINERIMVGPCMLGHGRSTFNGKTTVGKVAFASQNKEIYTSKEYRMSEMSFDNPLVESVVENQGFTDPANGNAYLPRLIGLLRDETVAAADALNAEWEKVMAHGHVPHPYVPLIAKLEPVDGTKNYVVKFRSRYGMVQV